MISLRKICAAAAVSLVATGAQASVVVLDFENIAPSYPSTNYPSIEEFYNGGTSSAGTSGTNYGISFSDNALAICLNTPGNSCSNTSRGGQGNPNSQLGGLFFLTGNQALMNIAAGFQTGFSFFYVSLTQSGFVDVFDDLDGQGNLLASISLSPNAGNCSGLGDFCPFSPAGIAFSGTAKSVAFGGVANQIVFDDITFGSSIPDPDNGGGLTPIPLPAAGWLMLAGLGGLGALSRRRRKEL